MGTRVGYRIFGGEGPTPAIILFSNYRGDPLGDPEEVFRAAVSRAYGPTTLTAELLSLKYQGSTIKGHGHKAGDQVFAIDSEPMPVGEVADRERVYEVRFGAAPAESDAGGPGRALIEVFGPDGVTAEGTPPPAWSATDLSIRRAEAALAAHAAAAGVEGEASTQVWHLLMSLKAYCLARGIDLGQELAQVDEEYEAIHSAPSPTT